MKYRHLLKKEYPYGVLLFGLLLICFAFYLTADSWSSKSDLLQITGTLQNVSIDVSTHTNRGHQSQRAELIFSLVGRKQSFNIFKNIGDEFSDEEYDWIRKRLKESDSVSVWIRRKETQDDMPKVFQISVNAGEVLLDMEKTKAEHWPISAFLLVFGSLMIGLFFWKVKRPDVFNSLREVFE